MLRRRCSEGCCRRTWFNRVSSGARLVPDASAAAQSPTGRDDTLVVVANLDPHGVRETMAHLDLPALGLDWTDGFVAHDLLSGRTWHWGEHVYVRLDPHDEPVHVVHLRGV